MNYWFFFSYAHADYDDYLGAFYKDLQAEVRQLTGDPVSGIGFLDRTNIEHGATWDAALEQGLKNCKVFVPLYSPSYFRAQYCGKEFAVFRERLHSHLMPSGVPVADPDPLILPVLWNPENNVRPQIPTAINKIQYNHGSYPSVYADKGVSMMVRLGTKGGKYVNEYPEFVRELAKTIVDRANTVALPPLTSSLTALENVKAIFPLGTEQFVPSTSDGGPRYVQFIFVAAKRSEIEEAKTRKGFTCYGQKGGSDWYPYLDAYQGNAKDLALGIIDDWEKGAHYEEVTIITDIKEQVEQAAKQEKIVVVMVDTWTLQLKKYKEIIAPLDSYTPLNCITMIAWNDDDEEATIKRSLLEAAVGGVFQSKVVRNPPEFKSTSIKSYKTFKEELVKALTQARGDIITASKLARRGKLVEVETPHGSFASVSL